MGAMRAPLAAFGGVCHWDSVPAVDRETLMGRLSVVEIWGVATRLTKRLNGTS